MKLKNNNIVKASEALSKLLNTNLPVKQAYKIKKTLASIKKQTEFINEQRNELIKKYGVEKEEGYAISNDDKESMKKFMDDFNELLEMEEEIDVRTLTLDDLERIELTANELETIEFIIENIEE